MRNVMINTVEEDYVGLAHAKGLRDWRVMTTYAGRNAVLPRSPASPPSSDRPSAG